ncbi:dicer-like protein 1 [Venturia nashicola]|nr:dicer-like protein 1 [Venturia nashicola]
MALTETQIRERQADPDLDSFQAKPIVSQSAVEAQDESEDEDYATNVSKPLLGVEQRRQQNAIFESYLVDKAKAFTKQENKADLKRYKDAELSVENILASAESETIKDPREYQVELFEKAKNENIIAVLDTGSGKTLIAVLLLRHMLDKELEDRAAGKKPKLAFFLVPSVALVFQQYTVLGCNLDHKIARLMGGGNGSEYGLNERESWKKHIQKDMVIVCTAEILNQALSHSFISMDQINLLIFDEAHHAKGNHPYAVIIQQFYRSLKRSLRPRIFGMTASPVDAKEDVHLAAMGLEDMLQSRIATTPISEQFRSQAKELIMYYSRLEIAFETPLFQRLYEKFGHMTTFQRLFTTSKEASRYLGRWASDKYWDFALSEESARKAESKLSGEFNSRRRQEKVEKLDADIKLIQEAAKIVAGHYFGTPELILRDVSSKVIKLHEILAAHYERPTNNRCIVFVERRAHARLLSLMFQSIGGPNLKVGLLTGLASSLGEMNDSFRMQVMTMKKFREGDLNCLFATSVAEEGIDIPDCNLVIRFDLCKTMIQFVQSKGRARHINSKFIELMEDNNYLHRATVMAVRNDASTMRTWCTRLPDRVLEGNDVDYDANKNLGETFRDPLTGAKLTYSNSLDILSQFSSSLAYEDKNGSQLPHYIMSVDGGRSCTGKRWQSKGLAKRSAAFEMCINLLKKEFIDGHLLSVYKKRLPAFRNAQLALSSKKHNMYPMRLKPSLWSEGRGTMPSELYLSILDVSAGLDRPHQPLGLLTRAALPELPEFPLFLDSGKVTMATIKNFKKKLVVNEAVLNYLTIFTHRLWKDVNAKVFEVDVPGMSYWVAPIIDDPTLATVLDPGYHIEWKVLETVFMNEEYPWTEEMEDSFLTDKFLVDRWSGNRRFICKGVHPSYKPLDLVPEKTVKPGGPGGKNRLDILAYSISLWGKSGAAMREKSSLNQPVVETEQILHRQNWLAEPESSEKERLTKAYLCPQPLRISALPLNTVSMFIVFPAIIHRIEDYLISLEAANIVGIKVSPALALEACTKDSDNSDEHNEVSINFRSGMGPNYERLEFIGDCFLKMATSIALYGLNPNDDEFESHVNRMVMICNKNLFNTAKALGMPAYIRSMSFSRRLWYPEGLKLLHGKGSGKDGSDAIKHSLGAKSVADVCEAMIGAAFVQYNRPGNWRASDWDMAVKATTQMVSNPDHPQQKWDDYYDGYDIPSYQTAQVTASQYDLADKIYAKMGYRFQYPRLLRSAFAHPSCPYAWEKIPNYQRLEFLGDSLLDTACITHLFYNYPDKDPQWLTEHKMAMVANKFLGALCVKLGFHQHFRYNHAQLQHQIMEYVSEVELAAEKAKGEVDYWIGVKDPPKCLPDMVEAYIGAIFVDSSYNYSHVQTFFDQHMKPFFEDMSIYDSFANNHPTTHLHNLLSTHLGCQSYRLFVQEMPLDAPGAKVKVMSALVVHKKVVCDAIAASGRYAKLAASKNALSVLQGLAPFEFRSTYNCNCSRPEEGGIEGVGKDGKVSLEDAMGTAI